MRIHPMQFLLILVLIAGCQRSLEPELLDNVISVTITDQDIFEYKTGIGGDEEGAVITVQAQHYEISEIVRNSETNFEAVYRYKAKIGFKGSDYVEIETRTGSDGASPPPEINTIGINIVVN
jgi:hypothetical protein